MEIELELGRVQQWRNTERDPPLISFCVITIGIGRQPHLTTFVCAEPFEKPVRSAAITRKEC